MSNVREAVDRTEDQLFEAAELLRGALTKQEVQLVSVYARLYAATQLQRVAQELYTAGRHTLATEVVGKAEELKA